MVGFDRQEDTAGQCLRLCVSGNLVHYCSPKVLCLKFFVDCQIGYFQCRINWFLCKRSLLQPIDFQWAVRWGFVSFFDFDGLLGAVARQEASKVVKPYSLVIGTMASSGFCGLHLSPLPRRRHGGWAQTVVEPDADLADLHRLCRVISKYNFDIFS